MAPADIAGVAFSYAMAAGVFFLTAAAFVSLLRPRSRSSLLVTAVLAIAGAAQIAAAVAGSVPVVARAFEIEGIVVLLLLVALLWRFPVKGSPGVERAVFTGIATTLLLELAVYAAFWQPIFDSPRPLLWYFISDGNSLAILAATSLALARMRRLEPAARRGPLLLVLGLQTAAFAVAGFYLLITVTGLSGIDPIVRAQLAARPDHFAMNFVAQVAAPVVVALLAWRWHRSWFAAGALVASFVGCSVVYSHLQEPPLDPLLLSYVFVAAVPVFAIGRYGFLGTEAAPPGASLLVRVAIGAAAFFIVDAILLRLFGTDPLPASAAVAVGLAAAIGAALVLLPLEPARRAMRTVVAPEPTASLLLGSGTSAGRMAWGRYQIERRLATGGQARALLARDETLRRSVVLKVVDTLGMEGSDKRNLVSEARILASLDHPNVVRVFDVLETDGETILVLEYVAGGTLRDRLANGPLARRDAVRIFDGVLAALEAAHGKGIVHCDLKPENVLLTREGAPKLADFGIARATSSGATMTSPAQGGGTPSYMSPEQARGAPLTPSSDLYSAAELFHEMLTGEGTFDLRGLDVIQMRARIAEGTPVIARACGPFAGLIRATLAKDPAQRPPTASALRALLAESASVEASALDP